MNEPFLSIMTRTHHGRSEYLQANMASVAAQSDQDVEHVILHDPFVRGLEWANRQYLRHRLAVNGRYVMMLDDDNVLTTSNVVGVLKATAYADNMPDLLQFRAEVGPVGVLPDDWTWMQKPIAGRVDGHTFALRRDRWQRLIQSFEGQWPDFHLLEQIHRSGATIAYVDEVLVSALAVGSMGWVAA